VNQADIKAHTRTTSEVFATLDTTEHGLSNAKASARLAEVGENKLPSPSSRPAMA
jgi:hypothetical protein